MSKDQARTFILNNLKDNSEAIAVNNLNGLVCKYS